MKLLLLCVIFACSYCAVVNGADDDYCFGKDKERVQTRQFTSKTAYQIIKGMNMEQEYKVPDCTPTKLWILHRHGTRLPSKSTIEKGPRLETLRDLIVNNYRVLRNKPETDALCTEDLIALQMWKWNTGVTSDKENYLTTQGYEDLRGTSKLYQKLYGEILPKEYNSSYYLFRHTDTQRTTESFKAFAEGLFGTENAAVAEDVPEKDLLLRPYDYCDTYNEQNYKGAGSESSKFRSSNLWNTTLANISKRLGFEYTLAEDDVLLMYDMCRYEQAWQVDRVSVWCAAFLPDQVTVFEYEDDLKYFYKSGYGFEDNTRLNCRLVQDMIAHLNSTGYPGAVAYFAHSTGIQTLISALGINKDTKMLNATNYNEMEDRRWKTSNIDPFAANFLAVKYQCNSEPIEKEKVIFFLNQEAVDFDWCKVGLCNWSDVLKRYEPMTQANCDDYYCRSGANALNMSALVALLFAAIAYLTNQAL